MDDYLAGGHVNFWTDGQFPTAIGHEVMSYGHAYFWKLYMDEAPQQVVMGVSTSKAANWLQVISGSKIALVMGCLSSV